MKNDNLILKFLFILMVLQDNFSICILLIQREYFYEI